MPAKQIVEILAEQATQGEPGVAILCVAVLEHLVHGGDAARVALQAAAQQGRDEVAKAAQDALHRAGA